MSIADNTSHTTSAGVLLIGKDRPTQRETLSKVIRYAMRERNAQITQLPTSYRQQENELFYRELYKYHPTGDMEAHKRFVENLCLSNRQRSGKSPAGIISRQAVQFIRNNGRPVLTSKNYYTTDSFVYRHGINKYRPLSSFKTDDLMEKLLAKTAKKGATPLKLTPMQEAFLRYYHPVRGIEYPEDYIRTVLNTPQYAAFVEELLAQPRYIFKETVQSASDPILKEV